MRILACALSIVLVLTCRGSLSYEGSSFDAVRAAVFSDAYAVMPVYEVNADLFVALRVRKDFTAVDRRISGSQSDTTYRSVEAIAALGAGAFAPRSPKWIQLAVTEGTPRAREVDFRDELRLQNYPGNRLEWEIRVADDHPHGKAAARWQTIGVITLDDYVISSTCDRRLHFAHPLYR